MHNDPAEDASAPKILARGGSHTVEIIAAHANIDLGNRRSEAFRPPSIEDARDHYSLPFYFDSLRSFVAHLLSVSRKTSKGWCQSTRKKPIISKAKF